MAAFATARKLATLIYRLLRWGLAYIVEGAEAYEKRYQAARINRLLTTAAQSGLKLAPKPTNFSSSDNASNGLGVARPQGAVSFL